MAVYNEEIISTIECEDTMNGYWLRDISLPFIYPVLALSEEAGGVAGKVATFVRKYGGGTEELAKQVLPKLGDTLFQLSETARQFGFTLQEVAEYNYEKLNDCKNR